MVKTLRSLALCGLLALLAWPIARAASTVYQLDRDEVALGEPLQLRIVRPAGGAGRGLEDTDLRALARDFEILEQTLGRDGGSETLQLTLYARRTGRLQLPTLGLGVRAPRVQVSDGSARVSRVQWRLTLDPPEPLLRQPTLFTLEACDDGNLLWRRPALAATEGLLLQPLHEAEIVTTRDGQRCTAHRWHWAVLPTSTLPVTLPLPVVEAGKFGLRLRFAPPPLQLQAGALPQWLPAQVAVGAASWQAEALPRRVAREQPLPWRLQVAGAYSAAALQALLALQLPQADARLGLDRYAPQIEALPADAQGLPQHRLTLYLYPREAATLTLPALHLPWYDPATGQLAYAPLQPPTVEVFDPRWQRALVLGGIVAGTVLALGALALLWRVLRWRLQRRAWLRALAQAETVDVLRRTVLGLGTPKSTSVVAQALGAWQAAFEQRWQSEGLSALVQALDVASFGSQANNDVGALRAQALRWAETLRPVKGTRATRCIGEGFALRTDGSSN